ncbi:hypothetical protein CVT26_014051 [Gymnopilus dilepis]|uniref:Uncharacterized protein n=1 Tax=Gymnopilus dilepis TaxID=231916 RepID=A0A409VX38_9AGAR|nr:hypothetical protein CVT26_014051 [Gymnopilus dilepis]
MSYESSVLQDIPTGLSTEDHDKLLHLPASSKARVLLYEELLDRYSGDINAQPYLLVQLADEITALRCPSVALGFYNKARSTLTSLGIVDDTFNARVQKLATEVNEQTMEKLQKSRLLPYHQKWKPTREYKFPTNLPHLPLGSQEVRERWRELTEANSTGAYLRKLAIETNHIEGVFLLTDEASL